MIFLIRISDKFYRYVYLKVIEGYRLRLESIILKKGGRGEFIGFQYLTDLLQTVIFL